MHFGAAQYIQPKNTICARNPLGIMIKASRDAFADAGAGGLAERVDTVCVVNSFSRDDENTPSALAAALGIRPRESIYSAIQKSIDAAALPEPVERADGPLTVEARFNFVSGRNSIVFDPALYQTMEL